MNIGFMNPLLIPNDQFINPSMPQPQPPHPVRDRASRSLTSDTPVGDGPSMPASPTLSDRIKRLFRNPLVLVGITWVVMAVLLAREILAR